MTAVVVTPSPDRQWIRALAGLRGRGVAAVVVTVDASSYGDGGGAAEPEVGTQAQQRRALRFALAEYDLKACEVRAGDDLGTVLA